MSTRQILHLLREYESRNVTFMEPDGSWPIVWARASGTQVWDEGGRKYLDLTAAFGVAAAGHANPRVVKAGQRQLARLPHAMGDVHPHGLKATLARELSRLTFERWPGGSTGKTIFGNSGFEAVEAALKTALLATGKPGVIAFRGGYHGLGYGALSATHRAHFRSPFRRQLREFGHFVRFPDQAADLGAVQKEILQRLRQKPTGAILVEPIQARGGINLPPPGFLALLRKLCDAHGVLLIVDEIYTGFGRTGKWFACEHEGIRPDLICLGKALTGGFPLSACVGRADLMDAAWPPASGEAIHTSTFLGNPVGCAMALAQIAEIKKSRLPERSARLGARLLEWLGELPAIPGLVAQPRGRGLMAGLELTTAAGQPATTQSLALIKQLLQRGFIFLPEGEHANVISFTPPLTISEAQLRRSVKELRRLLTGLPVAKSTLEVS
jgi:4-aminobutyrate aminotransferase-like enzyme